MVLRRFWLERLEKQWERRSIIWLAGVRRVGKTFLARSASEVEYFDCELPRVRRGMDDPEAFLSGLRAKRVVLDEVHRLSNPSELLKIAADHFPTVRVLATGSSTLGATRKFRDTLAGRKAELWLTPMVEADLLDFRQPDVRHRLLQGGLPPYFLSAESPEREFQDWIDAYWAKDIQELFRLERRQSFQRFLELLLAQSGGMFEATRFAAESEVSRTTIGNYLRVLEETFVVHVVRPFSSRRSTEIVGAPKVYGFDTGFVCAQRGWRELRGEDLGQLWEHYVLNELHAQTQSRSVFYWRDKRGHEVDFVWAQRGRAPLGIECKWSAKSAGLENLAAFLRMYPQAQGFVVTTNAEPGFTRECEGRPVRFGMLKDLVAQITGSR
jgi:predicted AAA+ superfamily ATPase